MFRRAPPRIVSRMIKKTTIATMLATALLCVAVPVVPAVPAGAAPSPKTRALAPSSFADSNGQGCTQPVTTAQCQATADPGDRDDPTMRGSVSVVDPFSPIGVAGAADDSVVMQQVVIDTIPRATSRISYDWTFVVDDAIVGSTSGGQGSGSWTADLTVLPYLDDCPWFPYTPIQVFATADTQVAKTTTFRFSLTYGPCAGSTKIPAGTKTTLTAKLRLAVAKQPGSDGTWNGRADLAGAVRTVSVTAS